MEGADSPSVSVVTPFYNTSGFLGECIESVLSQTLTDFEYVLVDNASDDGSLQIAEEYAAEDPRVRVVHYDELLPQIPNYNRALALANPEVRYCKLAQADDVLLPRCLEEMVSLADSDPEIALVGSYTILQHRVFLDGLDYYETVLDGAEVCRRYFEDGPYLFGSPTTHMYRMADVQSHRPFFPEGVVFADTEAAIRVLLGGKLGFVHQVLSFVRTSNDSISTRRKTFDIDALTRRMMLEKYGREILSEERFQTLRRRLFRRHHRFLGKALITGRPREFWELHKQEAAGEGLEIKPWAIGLGAVVCAIRMLGNLETTLRSLWKWARKPGEQEPRGR